MTMFVDIIKKLFKIVRRTKESTKFKQSLS